ncbi:hypothetical protein HYH03_008711 [Edaphochlamys debaryana]|uniref:SMP-LTD domain-containing protein n=1 Tax=Edaphochlamys debaryana TaxID=47281 RepID=A0A836BZ55_9CHLO|nr:hypothetical protein HYH03_008711 [Edaphochlamys debaryana]|eukprot:KAG2493048.1 hypothetical protein HYH03_008711 [Edaphochlamys debaryana]
MPEQDSRASGVSAADASPDRAASAGRSPSADSNGVKLPSASSLVPAAAQGSSPSASTLPESKSLKQGVTEVAAAATTAASSAAAATAAAASNAASTAAATASDAATSATAAASSAAADATTAATNTASTAAAAASEAASDAASAASKAVSGATAAASDAAAAAGKAASATASDATAAASNAGKSAAAAANDAAATATQAASDATAAAASAASKATSDASAAAAKAASFATAAASSATAAASDFGKSPAAVVSGGGSSFGSAASSPAASAAKAVADAAADAQEGFTDTTAAAAASSAKAVSDAGAAASNAASSAAAAASDAGASAGKAASGAVGSVTTAASNAAAATTAGASTAVKSVAATLGSLAAAVTPASPGDGPAHAKSYAPSSTAPPPSPGPGPAPAKSMPAGSSAPMAAATSSAKPLLPSVSEIKPEEDAAAAAAAPAAAAATPGTDAAAAAGGPADAASKPSFVASMKSKLSLLPGAAASAGKVAAEATQKAGQGYVAAGKETQSTVKALLSLREKEGPPVTFTVDQLANALFFAVLALQLLFLPIFLPSAFRLVYSLLWGLALGLGLSYLFFRNRAKKAEANEALSLILGLKGVKLVLGELPSYFNVSETEKMEWFNQLILEVWPFIDKAVCQIIKDITAQVMPGVLKTLPAPLGGIVKSIGFKHLTFGNAPFRVESMWVSRDEKDCVLMEVAVKWSGDPNITLAIETPTGKMCPRVLDISFAATARIKLYPLVDRIPGFVAAMATVPAPPLIKYRLDFGKALGGSVAPAAVTPVVNYFMKEVITGMLVWPQRLVVPILQETSQDRWLAQGLMRRHRGILRVQVVRAKDLNGLAANDMRICLSTDSEQKEFTKMAKAPLVQGPNGKAVPGEVVTWPSDNVYYLLVQEPADQAMRVEAYTGGLGSGKAFGRALVRLQEVCRAGERGQRDPIPTPASLGDGDWGSPGGPGKGYGKVSFRLTYFPFERIRLSDTQEAAEGIVTVRLLKLRGLPADPDSVTASMTVTTTAGDRTWAARNGWWSMAAHVKRLEAEQHRVRVARDVDEREGRTEAAAEKAKRLALLEAAVADRNTTMRPLVSFDYATDAQALTAFYHVIDTVPDTGAPNALQFTVNVACKKDGKKFTLRASLPIAQLRVREVINPITGNKEVGGMLSNEEETDPLLPPPYNTITLKDEVPLEGYEGAGMLLAIRYAPHIPPPADALVADTDDFADTEKPYEPTPLEAAGMKIDEKVVQPAMEALQPAVHTLEKKILTPLDEKVIQPAVRAVEEGLVKPVEAVFNPQPQPALMPGPEAGGPSRIRPHGPSGVAQEPMPGVSFSQR